MIGEYVRFTSAELDRAIIDPQWARVRADALLGYDVEDETEDDEGGEPVRNAERAMDVHKYWHMLSYLLVKADAPIDVALGGTVFAEDEDWGYGPPRYFTPTQVDEIATYLRNTPYASLAAHFDADDMNANGIYLAPWDGTKADWPETWYAGLTTFFAAAAVASDAIISFLD